MRVPRLRLTSNGITDDGVAALVPHLDRCLESTAAEGGSRYLVILLPRNEIGQVGATALCPYKEKRDLVLSF
jgi:hypothetical protein